MKFIRSARSIVWAIILASMLISFSLNFYAFLYVLIMLPTSNLFCFGDLSSYKFLVWSATYVLCELVILVISPKHVIV